MKALLALWMRLTLASAPSSYFFDGLSSSSAFYYQQSSSSCSELLPISGRAVISSCRWVSRGSKVQRRRLSSSPMEFQLLKLVGWCWNALLLWGRSSTIYAWRLRDEKFHQKPGGEDQSHLKVEYSRFLASLSPHSSSKRIFQQVSRWLPAEECCRRHKRRTCLQTMRVKQTFRQRRSTACLAVPQTVHPQSPVRQRAVRFRPSFA